MKKLIGFTFGGFLILTDCSSVPKAGQGIIVGLFLEFVATRFYPHYMGYAA